MILMFVVCCSLVGWFSTACSDESGSSDADNLVIGLILKTDDNPFFLTIEESAQRRADELGVTLRTFFGEYDGDSASQIAAIDSLVADAAVGILITPSDPDALADAVRRARDAGVMVVALDSPFDPADLVDATFATDNFEAGQLIGMWAAARTPATGDDVRIALLNGSPDQDPVDVLRNQGFLEGFGIDLGDPSRIGDEADARIVGSDTTSGSEAGGRSAMERLWQRDSAINLVYAINEPAATGAAAALADLDRSEAVLIVTIDGACSGVQAVADGKFDATVMQYPARMATLGIEAVVDFALHDNTPSPTPGLDFHNTGVTLVTDQPVSDIPSVTSEQALDECWK